MNEKTFSQKLGALLLKNNVTVMFIVLCLGCYFVSSYTLPSLAAELFTRIGRNTFLVLSLLIPVVAGLGLNFGIVIGAIAAQIAIFFVVHWGFTGFAGLMLCVAICTPLSIIFGYLVGRLFNSMKGAEMIGGLVAGFFSDGLYQLFFLFILGGVIPIADKTLMISTGMGVKNVINLKDNLKYSLDNVAMISILDFAFWATIIVSALLVAYRLNKKQDLQLKRILLIALPIAALYALSYIPFVEAFLSTPRLLLLRAVEFSCFACIGVLLYSVFRVKVLKTQKKIPKNLLIYSAAAVVIYASTYVPVIFETLCAVQLPVLTYLCIAALCLLVSWFMTTKLGQEMRTVGQSRTVAASSGINVDRNRIIAMIISTVLASYGQLISLQNIGTVATYGSHQQVGLYAIAALLVGGASVNHATAKQAVLGVILFHTLFILSPNAGKMLLGNAQIGEYFRVFVAYGVIAIALAMHAWSASGSKSKSIRGEV